MRKLIAVSIITLSLLSLTNVAIAQSPPNQEEPKRIWLSYSTLNDIQVPDEILMAIQMEYPGFAATKAAKVSHNGQELYQLRIDKSDIPTDYDGFYLYFDTDWTMVEKEDINAPAPVFQPKQQSQRGPSEQEETNEDDREEEQEKPEKPVEIDDDEEEEEIPEEQPDNSGSGSNGALGTEDDSSGSGGETTVED